MDGRLCPVPGGMGDHAKSCRSSRDVNFQVGDAIQRAGGSNSAYVSIQLTYAW